MATNTRKYYVYYDKKTGAILSATNEKSSVFEHGIEVEFAGNTKCYLHEFFEYSPLRLEYTPDSSVKQQELGSPQVQLRTVYIPARAFPLMAASQERADVWNILAADNVCNFV